MRIIDRYMLRQFVQVFVICFSSLTGLYIVFDAFSNLDEFIKAAEKQGNLLTVLGSFYSYRAIAFFDRTSGILALISAMFTITWIQRHNELTALSAAGISTGRVIRPVLIAAISISALSLANRELVIPRVQDQIAQDPKNLTGDRAKELQPRYDLETDILFRGREVYEADLRIVEPNLFLPVGLDEYGKQLKGTEAQFEPKSADHASGYRLKQVTQPEKIDELPGLSLGDRKVIITSHDAPWLNPGEVFVASNMDFEQLTGANRTRQFSSTWQLIRGLRNPSLDYGADVRVTIHMRLVQPFLDTTLLFLGLPLILSRENRNLFLAIGLCAAVVTVFMLVVLLCQFLGGIYFINPALAAWLPLMLFVPVAVFMSDPLVR